MHQEHAFFGGVHLETNHCGDCRYYLLERERELDSIGRCKLGKQMGVFRSTMAGCERFALPGDDRLPEFRKARARRRTTRTEAPDYAPLLSDQDLKLLMGDEDMSKSGIAEILAVSRREGSSLLDTPDAVVTFSPRDDSLQSKEVPAGQFSNKLFMMHGNHQK